MLIKLSSLIFVTCWLFLASCKKEEITDLTDKSEVENIIESTMVNQNLKSVSFALVKNDSLLWSSQMGYADIENNIAANQDTRYLIASISKTFTAVAALQLCESGVLSLDSDINNYLPFQVRHPDFPNKKITLKMLLNHSSGISDSHYDRFDLYCFGFDCPTSLSDHFTSFFTDGMPLNSEFNWETFEPGSEESYSNNGNALIGLIVELASGISFDTYCNQNIFSPLGMNSTSWRLSETPVQELAIPYTPISLASNPHYTFPDYPNGGLRTNPDDLSIFLRAMIVDGTFQGTKILEDTTVNMIRNLNNGVSGEMGLAFYYTEIGGVNFWGHSGGEQGATTEMWVDLETGLGVIVFNNDSDANLETIVYALYKYGLSL